jgi:hypothetical protein
MKILILGLLFHLPALAWAEEEVRKPAAVSTMAETELADFDKQPEEVQKLIRAALALTKMDLTYVFASHEPKRGGMDCSGTIYHLLTEAGLKDTPRQSDEMGEWILEKSKLNRIEKADTLKHEEFDKLKPGDLVFWSGTYESTKRNTPITHVMLYLGNNKATGKGVVFGASDGRSYEGQKRTGVSVFDFVLPKATSKAKLYGYGKVPGLVTSERVSPRGAILPILRSKAKGE